MTQTLAAPTSPPPAALEAPAMPAAPTTPVAPESVDRRITLRGVSWSLYQQLLDLVGDGLPRMTYDRGTLAMEMPSRRHEALKFITGQFIVLYAIERGIQYEAAGSTTLRQEAVEGGLEADESYYIQNYDRVAGREPGNATDPPPDLAVEIDLSPPDVDKASVYARLAVAEIWRWRDGRLRVLARDAGGGYAERDRSLALPEFPLDQLAAALAAYPQVGTSQAVADFAQLLRTKPGGT